MNGVLGPIDLVRLDAALVARLRKDQELPAIARACLVAIVLGAGAYGAAFGLWRAPLQAIFGGLKLPLVLAGVALLTAGSSVVLAPLLGARLSARQTLGAILVSLAVTSSILGALAPPAVALVLTLPPIESQGAAAIAQSLVLAHTLVIAVAGVAGVLALLALVSKLVPSRRVARRVVVAWMATQLLIGAQLSWLLRPFLGHGDRPVTFVSPDALEGGFFDEILRLSSARFGAASPLVLGWLAVMLAFWLWAALFAARGEASVIVHARGLEVHDDDAGRRVLPWPAIAEARAHGPQVIVRLARDASLVEARIEVPCRSAGEATALAEAIETARTAPAVGPYRSAPA